MLLSTILVLSFIIVQHVGQYTSFGVKYGIAFIVALPLILAWFAIERKFEQQIDSDHQRSLVWIFLFLFIIPIGTYHILLSEWNYQYYTPMCDCDENDSQSDRVGAICNDGFKSHATGRGTCSEHDGVQKWQCQCD
ncbi:hypothetical protein [Aureispira sp. CCB-QB1]|uniref:hypothetical protein n=1 Tax=Aureispira sp. CCB-QB1 TaxID=1313421 RepID=UPI0012DE7500|nr:hypothetical protein [Aureispira sp. CCB-QB1]